MLYLKFTDVLNAKLVKQLEEVISMLMNCASSVPQSVRNCECTITLTLLYCVLCIRNDCMYHMYVHVYCLFKQFVFRHFLGS